MAISKSKPLVSGFTVIRNGVLMGYPVIQSIKSVLPLVDEFVVGVGQSDDNTKEMILAIGDPKIRIFDSFWDTKKTKGGLILSEKTNEALDQCKHDWCFYIQADEVVHEEDYPAIREALAKNADDTRVQGLLFKYIHFYGSYGTIATNRKWYRNEVRIVRRSTGIRSHNDAQGFRVGDEKPWVKPAGGRIFHYGWVKPPKMMGQKSKLLNRWWHGDKMDKDFEDFQYDRQYGLKNFEQTHPAIMRDLVASQDWSFDPRRRLGEWKVKDLRLLTSDWIEKATGHRLGEYKPYRLIQD
jgi:glycosyltransferase involved in cell wall biosynthesis